MSSFFEEKTKQLNTLFTLTSLLRWNITCYLNKFSFSLTSVFLHNWVGGYRWYIRNKGISKQKGWKKMFLVFFLCPIQSWSHILKQYLATVEHWLCDCLNVYIYSCYFFFTWEGASTEDGNTATALSQSYCNHLSNKNKWLFKARQTHFHTANFIPGVSTQNYQELCLRKMCTCIAWAQFLYIIMLYCFEVILQMWIFNQELYNWKW